MTDTYDVLQNSESSASWITLPRKDQLAILASSRFVDFFQVASLQSHIHFQLYSFDTTASASGIAWQSGIVQGSFTVAQCVTAVLWCRLADNPSWGGRKRVLIANLIGTGITCIGMGFATTFFEAVLWRTLGGALGGGNVSVVRTMVSEVVKERRFQSRAFLLLPVSFNFAMFLRPLAGGSLSNWAASQLQGKSPGSHLFPYLIPNLLSGSLLFVVAIWALNSLEETLPNPKQSYNWRNLCHRVKNLLHGPSDIQYVIIEDEALPNGMSQQSLIEKTEANRSFRDMWTFNMSMTLVAQALFDLHMGAFNNLWTMFLSTDESEPGAVNADSSRHLSFIFQGGLGMLPRNVGFTMASLGVIGLVLQLILYPTVQHRLGTLQSYQIFCGLFPVAYFLAPYLALISPTQLQAIGVLVPWLWLGIAFVLLLQVGGRTFALPATIILLNNAAPHPSLLGTVHGVGHSVSAAARTMGPVVSGYLYSVGIQRGVVGMAWWVFGAVALVGWVSTWYLQGDPGQERNCGEEKMVDAELDV